MDDLKNRLAKIEKTLNTFISSLKKIEDAKNKRELYDFSTQQLTNWLKENEIDFKDHLKDKLVDVVWNNMNEWEWEYYDDEEDQEEEEEESEDESLEDIEDLEDIDDVEDKNTK